MSCNMRCLTATVFHFCLLLASCTALYNSAYMGSLGLPLEKVILSQKLREIDFVARRSMINQGSHRTDYRPTQRGFDSFLGSNQIPRPNIDALAYNGVNLNRHYTMPTCTPSRTNYLTGEYPIHTGMQGYPLNAGGSRGLPLEEVVRSQRLQELDYVARMIDQGSHRTGHGPTQRGFDSFLGSNQFPRPNIDALAYNGVNLNRHYTMPTCTPSRTDYLTGEYPIRTGVNVPEPGLMDGIDQWSSLTKPDAALTDPRKEILLNIDQKEDMEALTDPQKQILLNTNQKEDMEALTDPQKQILLNTNQKEDKEALTDPQKQILLNTNQKEDKEALSDPQKQILLNNNQKEDKEALTDPQKQILFNTNQKEDKKALTDPQKQILLNTNQMEDKEALTDPQKQILLNIDRKEDKEALINRGCKLSRGDYNDGVCDGFYGEDGRGLENPNNNITHILNSEVNQALKNIPLYHQTFVLYESLILDL